MRKIFAASAMGLLLLSGCASVDSGAILDKIRESGRTEWDCDKEGKKKVCGLETLPDKCMFQLDNGKETGWLEVDCSTEYDAYQRGENYPR